MLKDPADLERFLESAAPGSVETYGRGDHPPRDLVRAMRPFVDAGAIIPVAKREASGFLFLVRRGKGDLPKSHLARSNPGGAGQSGGRRNWRRRAKTTRVRILEILVRAAVRGLPCPTYAHLGQLVGVCRKGAEAHVRQLIRLGHIASEYDAATGWRVITILGGAHAGKQTMGAPGLGQRR